MWDAKGYGFTAANVERMSSCISPLFKLAASSLQEGQRVQFDVTKGQKGWQAENVQAV